MTGIEITIDIFWILYMAGACLSMGAASQFVEGWTLLFKGRSIAPKEIFGLFAFAVFWWVVPLKLVLLIVLTSVIRVVYTGYNWVSRKA